MKLEMPKIPNFDDVDLGIAGIVILGIAGLVVGWLMKADTAVLFLFAGQCITGISALVRGLKRASPPPPKDPLPPV